MELTPYLFFDGNCAEAFRFYEKTLGGTLELMRAGDAPSDPEGPQMPPDSILHACLTLGGAMLMGSDEPLGYNKPQGMQVAISVDSTGEGRRIFDALGEGGTIAMPFSETFWSPGFGMVTDRFGTPWMISTKPAA